ncbi:MAG: acyl-CoA carboxylase subunit beta [Streptosporangiales bacterium]|nr:acyl-CoA carboxylase subunit beta [Streptosporangiales bacterium]
MGGDEQVARQHERGKLTVRERLDRLFDQGTFVETGLLAEAVDTPQSQGKRTPADGCVTGVGDIDGRKAAVIAYDFTVLAGSIGMHGERKAARTRELAVRHGMPLVYLLDSAGARVTESVGASFAGAGDLFRELSVMSGAIPQVGAMLGPCSAGTAYIPALCDFVPMVKGTSSMALAGVHLVKAATGEEVTEEEMGGSGVHNKISGVADRECADDAECLRVVRGYLSYFPSRYGEAPPVRPTDDPADRRSERLYDIVPANPRQAYDMRRVLAEIADDGEFFPIKPDWAKAIITGFARFGGRPAGVVASQPMVRAGSLGIDEADKAARFINLCDAFGIPLVFLVDVPGFVVGKDVEHRGIIRHGAKMLYNVSAATVPKITVVLRKAYGAGYFVMAGRAYECDYLVAWPSGEFSVMGPEGAVNILFRRQLAAAESEEEREHKREELLAAVRSQIDPYLSAKMALVDDLIDPADTRRHIAHGLEVAARKEVHRPPRKRGVAPV